MKLKTGGFKFIKRPRFFVPAIIILMIVVVAVIVVRNMSQPAVGEISQQPPAEAEKIDPYSTPGTYSGKYVSFKYPAHYKAVKTQLSGDYLEVAEYHSTDATSKQLTVGVHKGSLDTEAGLLYRRQHNQLYRENTTNYGIEFTKNDGTEDTFYLAHGGLVASVSVTAPYNNQIDDAQYVASGLKWL